MTGRTLPAVSVVMPVRNEVASVEEALLSALGQNYPGPLEVVVADGMSEDGTRELLDRLAGGNPRVRLVENPRGSTPAGLNAAIRASSGEVIVRCDGHAVLPPDYVRRAVEILGETGADNVGGIQAAQGKGVLQRAIALGMSTPFGVGDARFHYGGPAGPADTVYLGAFRRSALERVGLFDESLGRSQDSDLNYRIRASGGSVYFHPDLRVVYRPRPGLGSLWQQYWRSGAWKRELLGRRPGSLRWRQLVSPALVLALFGSAILALTPWRKVALLAPALYAAEVMFATIWTALRRGDPAALLLPVVLPTMHLAWGLGFLLGRPS